MPARAHALNAAMERDHGGSTSSTLTPRLLETHRALPFVVLAGGSTEKLRLQLLRLSAADTATPLARRDLRIGGAHPTYLPCSLVGPADRRFLVYDHGVARFDSGEDAATAADVCARASVLLLQGGLDDRALTMVALATLHGVPAAVILSGKGDGRDERALLQACGFTGEVAVVPGDLAAAQRCRCAAADCRACAPWRALLERMTAPSRASPPGLRIGLRGADLHPTATPDGFSARPASPLHGAPGAAAVEVHGRARSVRGTIVAVDDDRIAFTAPGAVASGIAVLASPGRLARAAQCAATIVGGTALADGEHRVITVGRDWGACVLLRSGGRVILTAPSPFLVERGGMALLVPVHGGEGAMVLRIA